VVQRPGINDGKHVSSISNTKVHVLELVPTDRIAATAFVTLRPLSRFRRPLIDLPGHGRMTVEEGKHHVTRSRRDRK
jgi:hypothetical protein